MSTVEQQTQYTIAGHLPSNSTDLDSDVLIYTECEHCYGLFSLDTIEPHVRIGHETEFSLDVRTCSIRRQFAVTELPKTNVAAPSDCVVKAEPGLFTDNSPPASCSVPPALDSVAVERNMVNNFSLIPNVRDQNSENHHSLSSNKIEFGQQLITKRRKYQCKKDTPRRDSKCRLKLTDFPDIPTSCNTELLSTRPSTSSMVCDADEVTLRNNIQDRDQMKEWVDELSDKSGTNWILTTSKINRNALSKQYCQYVCRYSNSNQNKCKDRALNLNCKAQLMFNIRTDNCCVIKIGRRHTHEIGHRRQVHTKPASKETVYQFECYFNAGLRVSAARSHHEKVLRSRDGFSVDWLTDSTIMPTQRQTKTIYEKFIKQYGIKPEEQKSGGYDARLEDEMVLPDI